MGQETFSAHLELAATICGMILLPMWAIWRDIKKESVRRREEQAQQHLENRVWMKGIDTQLKTMLEPMHAWWIRKINGGGD